VILPDEYICDFNINRNSVDSFFNSQGLQLLDLCIASQLRVLNGRFIGDMLGNMTCYKPNGTSTVDYTLASVDLVNSVNFFQVLDLSYLSDHVQIAVYLNCNMLIPNMNLNYKPNVLKKSYKWEHISKETLFNVLPEVNTVEKMVHYENSDFEKNKVGVENAEQELGKIFESLAQQSCKIIRCFKKKISKKKKPWVDRELTDLKKTVSQLGNLLKKQPFNLNLENNLLTRSKECKKLIKKKTKQYKKELFDKLSALRDTDPKQYWKLLKSLKYEDSSKNIELQDGFEDLIDHFKSQGDTSDFGLGI
jgi:hypothetical protein